ncbi:MAG: hypothetical protein AAF570_16880, partial [Bacteroidota bacterium]
MKNTRFYRYLAALDLEEKEGLDSFVGNSVLNQDRVAAQLLRSISEAGWEEGLEGLDREDLFRRAFPDKAMTANQQRVVMSRLLDLVRDFMAFTEFQKDKILQDQMLLRAHQRRRLDRDFPAVYARATTRLEALPRRADWYRDRMV